MADETIDARPVFVGKVSEQGRIIKSRGDVATYQIDQSTGLETAIDLLAQMIADQPAGHVLIVGSFFGDEISSALDQCLLDVRGGYAVVELQVTADLYFRRRYTGYALCGPKHYAMQLLDVQGFTVPTALGYLYLSHLVPVIICWICWPGMVRTGCFV